MKKKQTCIANHIRAFHRQATEGRKADFGEPCGSCIYAKNCDFEWLSIMDLSSKENGTKISMVYPEKT